ncbi:hypothetical protein AO262_33360 [Pseudomonas fluorescens ABAC62]|nr:hypothetical protein AO262_33360 [Pseudomonas fluorescens ABAC62]
MPNMPDKPDTWAKIWLALSNPLWQGVIMSITVSLLRSWPPSLSVAAGGTIGFLGVTAIRELVTRFLGRKADAA